MSRNVGTVLRTLYYLKSKQLVYQIKYRLGIPPLPRGLLKLNKENIKLKSFEYLETSSSLTKGPFKFEFLNQSHVFDDDIDWNYSAKGKLWNYNLNYFDFICKRDLKYEVVDKYIKSYSNSYETIIDGKEAYPTSLRMMNFVKLICQYDSKELRLIIKKDVEKLYQSLEYHLLGNHLLENSFALYFCSHLYPKEQKLVNKSLSLLKEQLDEQILDDGGHYERSFMYHQILLGRLLECISISEANPNEWNKGVVKFLRKKAKLMLSWMLEVSDNGNIFQRFNDSVEGVSPDTSNLIEFANRLKLTPNKPHKLQDSGYRILRMNELLLTANVGNITPVYQPGHAHADSLSFTLHSTGAPIIVDPGISTYENNPQRRLERSTYYHNTVSINQKNNNEVWSSFRVGRRANLQIIEDSRNLLKAKHNGYRNISSTHVRSWLIENSKLIIKDFIDNSDGKELKARFHFHPNVLCELDSCSSQITLNNKIKIKFECPDSVNLGTYFYSAGFNKQLPAQKLTVSFKKSLVTTITL